VDPERYRQLEELYHLARENRAALDQADPELRREVESLLKQDGVSLPSLPKLADHSTVTQVAAGTLLGPYRIEARIGAGGMGEVYRAVDTRLDRKVAIKISARQFSERFEREARAIAALNHPHICTLYDVGSNYLVMELVEGKPLKGPLPLDQALRYGAQIADALAAAHAKGIVHRDLKPGNIMLTKSGVKVLDFGLAKSLEDGTLTATNAVMGTPAYMAPEQREGRECDARTDIYALGLVLREMAPDLPPHLARVVERCLATEPENRWHSAKDVQFELEVTSPATRSPAPPVPLGWIAAAAIALVAAFLYFRQAPQAEHVLRSTIAAPANTTNIHSFAISPNGRYLAIAAEANGKRQLWLRALDALRAQPMPGTDEATYPFWSPDSRYIAYFAQGKLKKIPASGGPAQTICDVPVGNGGSWNRDDVILFSPSGAGTAIQRVSAAGGVPADVAKREGVSLFPAFLPDGRHFLYVIGGGSVGQNGVYLSSLDGKENRRILPDLSSVTLAAGRLLFIRENTLMGQPFDAASGQARGEAYPVAEGVSFITLPNFAPVTASEAGVLVYESGGEASGNQIAWYDRSGKLLVAVGAPGRVLDPAISPDEKTVAFRRARGTVGDLWLWDLTRGVEQRFTASDSFNAQPSWSPKGDRIAFHSTRGGGVFNLYQKAASGTGRDELLLANGNQKGVSQWSRDGRYIVYQENDPKTKADIWVLPMDGRTERKPVPFLRSEFNELQGQLSPDGHWMAYTSDESGQREVYARPFPAAEGQWKISIAGGEQPRWRGDGKELFFWGADGKMMAVPVKIVAGASPSFEAGTPQPLFEAHVTRSPSNTLFEYDVSADGKRFLLVTDARAASAPSLTVVSNWASSR
jgi:serine/threonine protein kinase